MAGKGKAKPGGNKGKPNDKWRSRLETVECPTCKGGTVNIRGGCGLCNGKGTIQALKD